MHRVRPSKCILDLSRLDAFQSIQKRRTYWTGLLGGILDVGNCLRGGGAGKGTNWQQGSGSSGGQYLGERSNLFVLDLNHGFVSKVTK
jgi:hypothetical protein